MIPEETLAGRTSTSGTTVPPGSHDVVIGRVSVIVPTKNAAPTVQRCLASIRAQSYPDVELIVVDNGSADGTPDIARPWAHQLITTGPERSAQRNAGGYASTGEFLIFVDGDFVVSPRLALEVVTAFQRDPNLQALVIPRRSMGEGFWAKCKVLETSLYIGDPDVEAARGFRRSIFELVGGYDEQMHAGEDWDLSERIAEAGGAIGRVRADVVHDEGRISLRTHLAKRLYYGQTFTRYVRRHPGRALRKFLRMAFVRRVGLLVRDPGHALGLIFLKGLELVALLAGMLATALRRQFTRTQPRT